MKFELTSELKCNIGIHSGTCLGAGGNCLDGKIDVFINSKNVADSIFLYLASLQKVYRDSFGTNADESGSFLLSCSLFALI